MAKNVKLLLVENVEALGIVGDVVNVRTGYARNFLLPRNLATQPSDELVKQLAAKRADAEKQLAQQRKSREELTNKLKGVEIELIRSCNDQGILYGAITQQDVATALSEKGYSVKPRDVRIAQTIKRIDSYDVHIKLDSDLDSTVKLHVKPDRELDLSKPEENEPVGASQENIRRSATDEALAQDAKRVVGWGSAPKADAAPASDGGKKGDGEKKPRKQKA